jgi:hypothetical protein
VQRKTPPREPLPEREREAQQGEDGWNGIHGKRFNRKTGKWPCGNPAERDGAPVEAGLRG